MPLLGGKKKTPGLMNGGAEPYSSNEIRGVSFSSTSGSRKSSVNWKRAYKARREAAREAKVVQKSAAYVDKIVGELTDGRPFLQNTPNQPIAKFLRSEIVVGNLLGRGVFARVYEVRDIDLHDDEEYAEPMRASTLTDPFPTGNVEDALNEARDMIVLDDSSSDADPPTLDDRPFGTNPLEQRPLGQLSVIAEGDDTQQQEEGQGDSGSDQQADDSTTAGTSSTAPASAPPTPPLTPASETLEQTDPKRRPGNRLRFSAANYHQHFGSSRIQHDQSTLRLQARDIVRNGDGYALKHLTKTLLRNPKDFHLAAAALLVEAKYLSKLNHPNIIKVTGLAMCGRSLGGDSEQTPQQTGADGFVDHSRRQSNMDQEGIEGGQYDSYFLITERLTDTLDRRIRQWKRDQPTHNKLSEQTSNQKIQTWKHMIRKTSYALQVSNALAYMHERKVLYRDLKPQNIGFIGDNQTICIFNFGLCREMRPCSGTVQEDPVTALFGALSWKYTAVECFPQPVAQTPADLLSKLGNQSSRSFGLESLSNSIRGLKTRRLSAESVTMEELQRELRVVHEQYQDELHELSESAHNAVTAAAAAVGGMSDETVPSIFGECQKVLSTPEYDCKADVYSWAMVYYEMLTLNQPFSGMTQKEHLRKVAGPKGGQRPGVYQFDLTPSMISLLQRAWDQNPKKRPTMESVGRNLQLILKELETLIKEEQKALLKAAGGTEAAVAKLTSREERAAQRAKRNEEKEKQRRKEKKRGLARKSTVINLLKRTTDNVFARNRYRKADVRESVMEPPTGLLGPLPKSIPGLEPTLLTPSPNSDRASTSEVDVNALEYEAWSSGEEYEDDDDDESASFASESGEASSLTDHLNTVVTIDNAKYATNADLDAGASDDNNSVEEVEMEDSENKDVVGDAISAMRSRKRGSKLPLPSRDRNLSGASGGRRRRTKTESMKSAKSRRTLFDPLSLQRRGTNRMSRRTMRLSRASVWMMRRDVKLFVTTVLVLTVMIFLGSSYYWYKRRQATWLGVDLDELGKRNNETEARQILRNAMIEECRHQLPIEHDPRAPLLFQGGALSPVDLECMDNLERMLEQKMVRVTGFDPSKVVAKEVGFLGVRKFAKPPPQPKKSRWKRKQAWKFFREDPKATIEDDNTSQPVPLAGSAASVRVLQFDEVADSETCEEYPSEEHPPAAVVVDDSPQSFPEDERKKRWRPTMPWNFFREYPKQRVGNASEKLQADLLGFYSAATTTTATATAAAAAATPAEEAQDGEAT